MKSLLTVLLCSFIFICNGQKVKKKEAADTVNHWAELVLKYIGDTGSGNLGVSQFDINKEFDTLLVVMQVSDTAIKLYHGEQRGIGYDYWDYDNTVRWEYGYTVIKLVPAGWSFEDVQHGDYWEFVKHLDADKKPLPKNIHVWMAVEIKK